MEGQGLLYVYLVCPGPNFFKKKRERESTSAPPGLWQDPTNMRNPRLASFIFLPVLENELGRWKEETWLTNSGMTTHGTLGISLRTCVSQKGTPLGSTIRKAMLSTQKAVDQAHVQCSSAKG
eukprot:1156641-Pelagomonas_calceolata.AAC.12